jgi:exonuclease SbcC
LSRARGALDEAAEKHSAAVGELSGRRESLDQAVKQAADLEASYLNSLESLRKAVPGADPDREDDEILSGLAAAREQREKEAREARDLAEAVRGQATAARAGLEQRRKSLDERRRRLDGERLEADRIEARCRTSLGALPKFARPAGDVTSEEIPALVAAIRARRGEVEVEQAEHDRLRNDVAALEAELRALRGRWEREVDAPLRHVERELAVLRERLVDALPLTANVKADVERPAGDLAVLTSWAENLERSCRDILDALGRELDELSRTMERETRRVGEILSGGDVESAEALSEEIGRTKERMRQAEDVREKAMAQVPLAARLDRVLDRGRRAVATLRELKGLLADGQFVGHVIERRQRDLLAVATGILDSMTGGRYGFAADFQVVDRSTQQPRSTKTLSGGESFLASLALALGLVEIAGRAGGRLDALFLDEGFGALDGQALDEALTALERRASPDRLVVVVSHLKAVAERIESVLLVTRTPAGSRARWIDGTERGEIVAREIESGLLV